MYNDSRFLYTFTDIESLIEIAGLLNCDCNDDIYKTKYLLENNVKTLIISRRNEVIGINYANVTHCSQK